MKLKSKATIIKFRVVLTTGAGRFSHINHVPFRDILNGILNGNSTDFILGGSRITTDGDCSHEIERRLLLGRKAMTNFNSVQFSHSVMSDSCDPMDIAHQAPLPMGFSRQKYRGVLPYLSRQSSVPAFEYTI